MQYALPDRQTEWDALVSFSYRLRRYLDKHDRSCHPKNCVKRLQTTFY